MNRKETAERIKIMQAFVDGKLIEFKDCMGRWCVAVNPSWDWDSDREYRIKSEPKYHTFKDAEECWQEMKKHEPFGWVKYKTDDVYSFICKVEEDRCYFAVNVYWAFDTILEKYTFADGTPFGIKEE
nr:MAG TPA: hypothetical protein [Caudoviricetes sp.]